MIVFTSRETETGIALLHSDGLFAVTAASKLCCAILDDIEAHDHDVFNCQAYVSAWDKIHRLLGIWWRNC